MVLPVRRTVSPITLALCGKLRTTMSTRLKAISAIAARLQNGRLESIRYSGTGCRIRNLKTKGVAASAAAADFCTICSQMATTDAKCCDNFAEPLRLCEKHVMLKMLSFRYSTIDSECYAP